jgi:peptidylprolyl isomerase
VVSGLAAIRAVAVGEPPRVPDLMLKARIAADLPAAERPRFEVEDERGPAFQARVAALRREKGAAFSVCDVDPRVR